MFPSCPQVIGVGYLLGLNLFRELVQLGVSLFNVWTQFTVEQCLPDAFPV